MATRSLIAIKQGDFYYSLYCHFDGYPDHVGKILKTYFKTEAKTLALMKLGDLRSLEEDGTWQSFQAKGESKAETCPCLSRDFDELYTLANHRTCEYLYLFDKNTWHVHPITRFGEAA